MDNNHLKDGKVIFPNRLKIKKKFNVGLIGSGKIAKEYIKVLKSFNHKLVYIYSASNYKNAVNLAKNNRAKIIYDIKEILIKDDIDFWIVCTSWSKLRNLFFNLLKIKKPVLFEKSLIINTRELKKIKRLKNFPSIKKNISFAYNRNYYDYIFYIKSILSKQKINYGFAYLHDPYQQLLKKKIPKKYLGIYITSHWISLILKIFKLCKIKIISKKLYVINKKNNFKKLCFLLKLSNTKFNFDLYSFPNLPKNHKINFFLENKIIEISPIEKINIFEKLQKKTISNRNEYSPKVRTLNVDGKFKPGFRYQYYDFINKNFYKKKTLLSTDFDDLTEIYKVLEMLNKHEN